MFLNNPMFTGAATHVPGGQKVSYTIGVGEIVPETTNGSVTFILLDAATTFAGLSSEGTDRTGAPVLKTEKGDVLRGRTIVVGDYGNWVLAGVLDLYKEYTLQGFCDLICAQPTSIGSLRDSSKQPHPWVETLLDAWQTVQEGFKEREEE